jgi:uncharacterized small protein (DUF1192 family)
VSLEHFVKKTKDKGDIQMNNKTQQKAEKLVQGAVGVFADAIAQVEKANEVLTEGMKQDTNKINSIDQKIANLQKEKETVYFAKNKKINTRASNNELIKKLKEFSV